MEHMKATAPSRRRWRPRVSAAAVFAFAAVEAVAANGKPLEQPEISTRVVKVLRVDGLLFKDLDKNGTLDAYEDWRRPIDERVEDLVGTYAGRREGGIDGRALPADGTRRHAERAADVRSEPFRGRAARARLPRH